VTYTAVAIVAFLVAVGVGARTPSRAGSAWTAGAIAAVVVMTQLVLLFTWR
jgi:hypothetical protein